MPLAGGELLDERTILLLKSSGIAPLTEQDLVAALDRLAWDDCVHTAVADIDWGLFRTALGDAPHRQLFAAVLGSARQVDGAGFVASLEDLDPGRRRDRTLDWACSQVAAVLGLSEDELRAEQGFFDLGLDSVMSLTLRLRLVRALDVELSSTVAFEHPTALTLTTHLLGRLGFPVQAPEESAPQAGPDGPAADALGALHELDGLDDDELLRQLEAKTSDAKNFGSEES